MLGIVFYIVAKTTNIKVNLIKDSLENKNNLIINDEYMKAFWVGLMDGKGNIQVNRSRKKLLQYRLVIELSNETSNYKMLIKIAKVIGGNVLYIIKNKKVIWVVNKKETIQEIIKIFDSYPLLTSKKICQLRFLKECMERNSIDWYLSNINNKYKYQQSIIISNKLEYEKGIKVLPFYFNGWFSGLVEAEGSFIFRKNNNHSFIIKQVNDIYLLMAIKEYFKASNDIKKFNRNLYILEIYKKETLKTIINHFHNYPLLGEKAESFRKLMKVSVMWSCHHEKD